MNNLQNLFGAAAHLFFPHLCIGCGSDVLKLPAILCFSCIDSLPHTGFEKIVGNPVEKIFYGRVSVHAAHSGFYFSKGSPVQHLIHELKYKENKEAGEFLGRLMGERMLPGGRFATIDYLLPLPLSAEKEFRRGYNQAEVICRGLSAAMNIPVLCNNVIRIRATDTQTKKHRAERWDNVAGSFMLTDAAVLANRHVLLVDDVITTGATLEACAAVVSAPGNIRLSIATLAVAGK